MIFLKKSSKVYESGANLFITLIAASYPKKQHALAGKARVITGPAPLKNPFGPCSFNKTLTTSPVFLNCPSGAVKKIAKIMNLI